MVVKTLPAANMTLTVYRLFANLQIIKMGSVKQCIMKLHHLVATTGN